MMGSKSMAMSSDNLAISSATAKTRKTTMIEKLARRSTSAVNHPALKDGACNAARRSHAPLR